MTILVTGAAGTLGSLVSRELAAHGHSVRAVDFLKPQIDGPSVEAIAADTTNPSMAAGLCDGVDRVAHLGAYHGVHLPRNGGERSEHDFFEANVHGTYNMLEAAAHCGVPRMVWASSVVVYERGTWRLFGIYSLSKVLGEEMAQYFHREHGLKVIGLRYGTFGFGSFEEQGFGMLGGLAHGNVIMPEEVVRVTVAALALGPGDPPVSFGMYDVQTPLPFTVNDEWDYLRGNRIEVLIRHWPQHRSLIERYSHLLPREIKTVRMHATQADLGVNIEHDFGWFLDELAARSATNQEQLSPDSQ